MERRDLLKKLLAVSSMAMVPMGDADTIELPDQIEIPKSEESFALEYIKYKGFRLIWTGWKHLPNQDSSVGQWIAYGPNGHNFYASYPGDAGQFYPGQIFDIHVHGEQEQNLVVWGTPSEKKKEYMLEALQRLMALIDKDVA